jgi:hypothetical protein
MPMELQTALPKAENLASTMGHLTDENLDVRKELHWQSGGMKGQHWDEH